ncbi:TMEM165/GDT1 family protein [Nodosilinea sp. LEGE 07298]|uniref:TMEM165/GDT1 family protein n=1 Tax=Nodosilinea sp. LEGE 07298 TaxID=2777970 RepID=UPI001882E047|nr:TMEM165/GDT1 family protein [Nodosilinea sp. LEGE 07298]MBE9108384.1 TMEM165/GDT1 family protein [Nodosilinea sp. LEGE 07298]
MHPLTGFTAALLLITLSELGDKTFFIGMILATRHPRRLVFVGVTAALFVMTVLSVAIGQVVTIVPEHYVQGLTVALFLGFGFKLLYDASRMVGGGSLADEQAEALEAVEESEAEVSKWSVRTVLIQSFSLTFVAEWGDRTQFATIALAAANHPVGVVLGATLGHAVCAAIAVACGKLVAGRISERWLTTGGGLLFIIFGLVAAVEMV